MIPAFFSGVNGFRRFFQLFSGFYTHLLRLISGRFLVLDNLDDPAGAQARRAQSDKLLCVVQRRDAARRLDLLAFL